MLFCSLFNTLLNWHPSKYPLQRLVQKQLSKPWIQQTMKHITRSGRSIRSVHAGITLTHANPKPKKRPSPLERKALRRDRRNLSSKCRTSTFLPTKFSLFRTSRSTLPKINSILSSLSTYCVPLTTFDVFLNTPQIRKFVGCSCYSRKEGHCLRRIYGREERYRRKGCVAQLQDRWGKQNQGLYFEMSWARAYPIFFRLPTPGNNVSSLSSYAVLLLLLRSTQWWKGSLHPDPLLTYQNSLPLSVTP